MQSGTEALAVGAQTGVVIDAVDKAFGAGGRAAGVSLDVAAGEFVAVVGPERLRQVDPAGARLRARPRRMRAGSRRRPRR